MNVGDKRAVRDDSFDDNPDDNCAPNYAYDSTPLLLNGLFTATAWS